MKVQGHLMNKFPNSLSWLEYTIHNLESYPTMIYIYKIIEYVYTFIEQIKYTELYFDKSLKSIHN